MAGAAGIRAAKAYVEIGVHSRLAQGLARASKQIDAFAAKARAVGASVQSVGARVGMMGAAVSAGIGFATKTFADFDDQMRLVKAVTGASEESFKMLTAEAERLGRTTSFTASEVAAGMVEMGRAGFDPREIMDSTEQILALSRATATELPRATSIAGSVLRGFALDASEMSRVSDVLTVAVNGSAQTLEDFYEGIKYVAPLAVEAGASLEDVSAAMAILANNGIRGSLAGNAIARAYKNLSTEAKQNVLRGIGVEAVDAAGNIRPLADILQELGEKTAGMGSAARLNIFEQLFGRGQASALKLAASGAQFDSILQNLEESKGRAVEIAQEMDAGIGGAFRMTASAIEGVFIQVGKAVQETVAGWASSIQALSQRTAEYITKNPEMVAGILKIAVGAVAAGAGLIALGIAIKSAAFAASVLSVVLKGLAVVISIVKAIGLAFLALNPIVLAVAAAVAAVAVVWASFSDSASSSFRAIGNNFSRLGSSLMDTWGSITSAIGSGDLALAGEIALTALELVWKTGLNAILSLWDAWVYDLAGAFVVIVETVKRTFYKVLEVIAYGIRVAAEALGMDSIAAEAGLIEQGLQIMGEETSRAEYDQIAGIEEMRRVEAKALQDELDEVANRLAGLNKKATEKSPTVEADELVLENPAIKEISVPEIATALAELPQIQNVGTEANRGTFSAFVANRLGTRTTYEDESLDLQTRTAEAVESIDQQMDDDGVGF